MDIGICGKGIIAMPQPRLNVLHCVSYWNTIHLEDFPKDELFHLIDLAYETVLHSFSKKVQAEILMDQAVNLEETDN